ncbi:hypothetical protein [Streptomyces anulatus]|uniref:hypothetical protein n=1 Tax=Streptomyces anulatus TaxID=1892 RepID=UPI00053B2707|nr:hypothetical protein [Streptomyces anulatus]
MERFHRCRPRKTVRGAASLDHAALLKDLQKQVALLEDDLRKRTEAEPEYASALRAEYDRALESERTAASSSASARTTG